MLAQACLLIGLAYFVGGVFGVFRHFLHGVRNLVNGGGHQLHLLGLLLAVALAIAGNLSE
ncbi:hypothetical protein D3C81_1797760 [compost metagenome]